jgi:hypothetical protein
VRAPPGPPRLLLLASCVFWEIIISGYFYGIFLIFKIWSLDGPFFQQNPDSGSKPLMIIKHVKTKEIT